MSGIYTAEFNGIAVSAAQDFFEVQVPADTIVKLLEFHLFQTTDVGDSAEEILRVRVRRQTGTLTSGSGGASVTPVRHSIGDAAAGVTVERNNTTQATGTLETIEPLGWNVRIPLEKIWTPETAPLFVASDDLIIDLPAAPADSLTTSSYITFEEID